MSGTMTLRPQVLLACLLAGCSTGYTSYMPPPPSAAASLQFVNGTTLPITVHLYDDAAECTGRHLLKALKPQEERVVPVPAGKAVAFAITYDVTLDRMPFERIPPGCGVTLSFKPEQGGNYVFRLDSPDAHRCVYRFNDASKVQPSPAAQVPYIKREAVRATSEAGPFCRN
jgi:hypothetical protein